MGDDARPSTEEISDEDRGLGAAARGLAGQVAAQSRRRRAGGKAYDRRDAAAARAESAAAAARLNKAADQKREDAIEQLLRRDADLGLGKAGQGTKPDAPSRPLSDQEAADFQRLLRPRLETGASSVLGPGMPLPAASSTRNEIDALDKYPEAVGGGSPPRGQSSWWRAPQHHGLLATLQEHLDQLRARAHDLRWARALRSMG